MIEWFMHVKVDVCQTERRIPRFESLLFWRELEGPRIIIRSVKIREWCPSFGWIFDRCSEKTFADFACKRSQPRGRRRTHGVDRPCQQYGAGPAERHAANVMAYRASAWVKPADLLDEDFAGGASATEDSSS